MIQDKLSEKVIASAIKVYNTLGYGFLEKIYENAMAIELYKLNLVFRQQYPITVYYEGENVGDFYADILVDDTLIVELKSGVSLIAKHEIQLVNYLVATNNPIGLLINFGPDGVEIKRKYKNYTRKNRYDITGKIQNK